MQYIVNFRAHQRFLQLAVVGVFLLHINACSIPVCCAPTPAQDPMGMVLQADDIDSPVLLSLLKQADDFISQQQWDRATTVLERAQRINNRQAEVWSRLAWISLQQNKVQQAIERARRANSYAVNNHELLAANWQLIADAYTALNQPQKALRAEQKSRQYGGVY